MTIYDYDDEYIKLFGGAKGIVIRPSWSDGQCLHENKEIYTEEVRRTCTSKNVIGYCIDCGHVLTSIGNTSTPSVEGEGCSHPTIQEDPNGTNICSVCFVEMEESLSFEPEWKFYENQSSGRSKDKSRCHRQRDCTSRGISSFFEQRNIKVDKATLSRVERCYEMIIKDPDGEQGRAGLIAAILFKDFKKNGNTRTSDYFKNLCGVTKKEMSAGISRYDQVFPDEANDFIRPVDILPWLLGVYGIDKEHHPRIKSMVELLSDCDPVFKNKTPKAVASSIIYLYLCLNQPYKSKLGMNKTKFAEKSSVSDITITKLIHIILERSNIKNVEL